jgi:hypothetical protein
MGDVRAMTDENKFFRYVWRFNAVVLAFVAIAAAIAILGNILNPWRPTPPEPAGHFAPVPKGAENGFTYRLASHGESRLVGQEELIALDRWNGSPETYGLKEMRLGASTSYIAQSRSVNLLAVNHTTVESHWIFKGYDRAIVGDDPVYDTVPLSPGLIPLRPDQAPSSTIALVMTVVDSDTNKDGELSEKDRQSLYVYRPGTMEAARLLTADLIVSRQQTSTDRYLVIYENGSSAVAATFSIPGFKLIAEKPLPKVPLATPKN